MFLSAWKKNKRQKPLVSIMRHLHTKKNIANDSEKTNPQFHCESWFWSAGWLLSTPSQSPVAMT